MASETRRWHSAGRAGARLHSARYVLLAATISLIGAVTFFDLPPAYALAAILVLLVAAVVPPYRDRSLESGTGARVASQSWPDTSMKATAEALSQPAFLLDSAGVVRYSNRRAAELFAATRPGDPFTLTFRWPEFAEALEEARAGRQASAEYREPGTGTEAYSVAMSPVGLPGSQPHFILITVNDVSDRLAIARMRADFVANASHELRTPLASLTGFIETLLGAARQDPAATEKFLRVMLEQARRMGRLIDDLLSLSRLEMRVHNRPTSRVDLVEIVRHVADAMGPLAEESAVVLSVEVPQGLVEVTGDRDELVQLVQNLAENAIRYGASGGRVDIRLEAREQRRCALIHVIDYGPGIAPDHLPRLTERFYRVDVGASRDVKGTGLGLSIVKHILTRHHGRLEVKSELGQGARFTAELPLAQSGLGGE
jgi:two-component system phosphate regulon sensor histidine kinase PhoR